MIRLISLWISVLLLWHIPSLSAEPENRKIILTGSGMLPEYHQQISVKELEQLFGLVTVEVYNPWEKQKDKYTGFWLSSMIKTFGSDDAKSVTISAIDSYQITFTSEDWNRYQILVATRVNNRYQSVRQKGPMRLIYADYDPSKIEHELSLPKWMWMIKKIAIE